MASTASAASRPRRLAGAALRRCGGQIAVVEDATSLVVLVPEADDALAASNRLLPSDKRLTAPARITLVYPFLPSDLVVAARAEMENFFAASAPYRSGCRSGGSDARS